jgi:putative Mn2+ efflux pump MntP
MLGSLAIAIVLFGLTVSAAIAFLRHRTSAVLLWIGLAWSVLVFGIAIGWVAGVLFGETAVERFETEVESVQGLISTALWTVYMLRSKRVRATFTRRYPVTANGLPAGPAASELPLADSPG